MQNERLAAQAAQNEGLPEAPSGQLFYRTNPRTVANLVKHEDYGDDIVDIQAPT
jgi:hypothetical protein